MNINSNNYSVLEIIGMLDRKELIVNPEYQRGSGLWPPGPSSYFIDTIIENYPFPKIYMYEHFDRSSRALRREIVDGQQRIKTITRFYRNEFALRGESAHAGKTFHELDDELQSQFLSYTVSVDVIRNATHAEILQMFRRMNAYTLPLNEPEKRHSSFQGRFKWFINKLSDSLNEFFVEFEVFTNRQIVRMSDAELLTDCVLAMERGVVSTGPSDLRGLYKKYDEQFPHADDYMLKIEEAFAFIASDLEVLRKTHMMKPYAVHSLITALIHCKFGIDEITQHWNVRPIGRFAINPAKASEILLALAQAHEAKEEDGPYSKYVWGCLAGTNRAPRRIARISAIFKALGVDVPVSIDGNLA